MSSGVKTYRVRGRFDPGLDLITTQEVVLARDYAALEAELAQMREALEHCSEVMKDPWKHGEGCISRAINRADAALAASAEGVKDE